MKGDKDTEDIKKKSSQTNSKINYKTFMYICCCICIICVLLFDIFLIRFLGQDLQKNEFNIYKSNINYMNFYDDINDKKYSVKMPIKFDGDILMVNGYADSSYIEYIKEYEHPNLQPVIYNNQSLMSMIIIKSSSIDVSFNGLMISYWCINNDNDPILDNEGINEYMQHFAMQNMEHKGRYLFIDKMYLDKDLPIILSQQFGFDTHKVNEMKFEFKQNIFYMNGNDGGIDIKLAKKKSIFDDIITSFDLIKSFGLKKFLKVGLNKNSYNDNVFYYTKPNISNRTPINVAPLIQTIYNIEQNSLFIKKIDENNIDNIKIFGKLKNRNFKPVSYVYLKSKSITIPSINGDRLNEEIKNLNQKFNKLNNNVSVLSQLNNTLHRNLTNLTKENNESNFKLQKLKERKKTLQNEIANEKKQYNISMEKISNLTEIKKKINDNITRCIQQHNEDWETINELNEKIRILTDDITNCRSQFNESNKKHITALNEDELSNDVCFVEDLVMMRNIDHNVADTMNIPKSKKNHDTQDVNQRNVVQLEEENNPADDGGF